MCFYNKSLLISNHLSLINVISLKLKTLSLTQCQLDIALKFLNLDVKQYLKLRYCMPVKLCCNNYNFELNCLYFIKKINV